LNDANNYFADMFIKDAQNPWEKFGLRMLTHAEILAINFKNVGFCDTPLGSNWRAKCGS